MNKIRYIIFSKLQIIKFKKTRTNQNKFPRIKKIELIQKKTFLKIYVLENLERLFRLLFTQRSVSAADKAGPVFSKRVNCERARATKHHGIRCSWSTSCLTEQHDGCNVCLRHKGGGGSASSSQR